MTSAARAAAEDRLLAEEVGLGLLREGRLEHAGAGAAERPGVGQRPRAGGAAVVPLHGEERRHAAALDVDRSDQVAGALGGDHADVDAGRRVDALEVDVEAVGEHEQRAGAEVGRDLGVVDGLLLGVGDQDHDRVGAGHGLGHGGHAEARLGGQGPALASSP